MLLQSQWWTFDGFSTILNNQYLNQNRERQDYNKNIVVEKVRKHIEFSFENFTTINFVEKLHKNEGMEEYGKVQPILIVPGLF